jgi:sterol desaturase/sphingolipid hydroxylase (fatty acid hydroxylase superfamily)
MVAEHLQHLKALIHGSLLGRFPPLERAIDWLLDFFTGPLTGFRTRSYWPELVAAILIAAAVFFLRDRRPGEGLRAFLRYCFPKRMFFHRSTWVDCKLIFVNSIVFPSINVLWRLSAAFFAGFLAKALIFTFGPSPHLLPDSSHWGTVSLVVFTFLIAMGDDFGYYVYHVAMHRVPWMWAFHKVHHSAEVLTVFANVRVHPMELLFDGPCRAVGMSLVLGPVLYLSGGHVPLATLFGMTVSAALWGAIGAQLHHSHIWLSWGRALNHVLISPAMHQIHHSTAEQHWNKNMGGNIALWDWAFGTICVPEKREELTFGLGAGKGQPHPTLLAAYVTPFREVLPDIARLLRWFRRRLIPPRALAREPAPR